MVFFLAALAAAAPVKVPVQGTLSDTLGAPLNGPRQVTFRLYDDAAGGESARTWFETQTVLFTQGAFSARLGDVQTLDSALLADADLHLSVTVADGTESGLTPVGWAPRAAYAVDAGSVGGKTLPDLDTRYVRSRGWAARSPPRTSSETARACPPSTPPASAARP